MSTFKTNKIKIGEQKEMTAIPKYKVNNKSMIIYNSNNISIFHMIHKHIYRSLIKIQ